MKNFYTIIVIFFVSIIGCTNDNEEDLYQEIDGLFRENVGVFNSYLKDNHIKFGHLFQ